MGRSLVPSFFPYKLEKLFFFCTPLPFVQSVQEALVFLFPCQFFALFFYGRVPPSCQGDFLSFPPCVTSSLPSLKVLSSWDFSAWSGVFSSFPKSEKNGFFSPDPYVTMINKRSFSPSRKRQALLSLPREWLGGGNKSSPPSNFSVRECARLLPFRKNKSVPFSGVVFR